MDNKFMEALKFVDRWEGFFSNNKADPGGKTKYGIADHSDGVIDGMIDLDGDGKGDVKVEDLTYEQAIKRLYDNYWVPSGAGEVPFSYGIVLFDTAVNCGVGRAKSIDRLAKGDPYKYLVERVGFYSRLVEKNPSLKIFYKGWINRCADLKKYVTVLINDSTRYP